MREEYAHLYKEFICCDLSMRRPGFALQRYYPDGRKVRVIEMSNVDNKTHSNHKSHGEILQEIAREFRNYLMKYPMATVIREEALAMMGTPVAATTHAALAKVVGVTDLYAFAYGGRVFDELKPQTIKKLVANDQNAKKDVIASALEQFVGKQEYACDDESDAVAVGVAWMIERGMIDDPYAAAREEEKAAKKTSRKTKVKEK